MDNKSLVDRNENLSKLNKQSEELANKSQIFENKGKELLATRGGAPLVLEGQNNRFFGLGKYS